MTKYLCATWTPWQNCGMSGLSPPPVSENATSMVVHRLEFGRWRLADRLYTRRSVWFHCVCKLILRAARENTTFTSAGSNPGHHKRTGRCPCSYICAFHIEPTISCIFHRWNHFPRWHALLLTMTRYDMMTRRTSRKPASVVVFQATKFRLVV